MTDKRSEANAVALAPELQRVVNAWARFTDFWGHDSRRHIAKARTVLGDDLTNALIAAVAAPGERVDG